MINLQKILIVDDNIENRNIIKEALNGFSIIEAENGDEAFYALTNSKDHISAIFLDTNMPVMNGYDFLYKLRSNDDFSAIPVIVTISEDIESSIVKALEAGANDLIKQPFKADVIRKRLSNALLLQKALIAAERDPLTKILNRTAFTKYIEKYFKNNNTSKNNAALFMIDIDDFKQLNDTFGHGYGDSVLIEFAKILEESTDKNSMVGRMGGDEFVVLLKDITNINDVKKIAEDILYKLSSLEIIPNTPAPTCSIGISLSPKDGESFRDLYFCADEALYEAKQFGKNQYYLYSVSAKLEKRKSWTNKDWLLDEQDSYIYICDAETHEVYYLNLKGIKLLNSAPSDSPKCLCYLLGLSRDAFTFCSEQPLTGKELCTKVCKSWRTGEILLYKGKLIDWNGRIARMGIVTAIASSDDKEMILKVFD